jgi:hypothetical protein
VISGFKWLKLGLGARLALAASLYSLAALVQVLAAGFLGYWLGIGIILLGWVPLAMKGYTNKPDDKGLESWRAVTMAEIDRVADTLRRSKEVSTKLGPGLHGGLGALMIIASAILAFFSFLEESRHMYYLFGDLLFMSIPIVAFGNVTAFVPRELEMKLGALSPFFSESPPALFALVPYLRFDEDRKGGEVPEDVRASLELKRPKDDFISIQFQAAINTGPNGAVPYVYGVVITKGRGGSAYRIASDARLEGFIVEPGGNDEYGCVVIRQQTEGTGYHTTRLDCERLRNEAYSLAGQIARA